uniref:Uncharacterized protein n=1 Tax=Leersia perrieri TaxID=77586 RepID=A0A0D9XGN7_9ORYZ
MLQHGVLHLLAAHHPWLCPWHHLRSLCTCCSRLRPAPEGILYPCLAHLYSVKTYAYTEHPCSNVELVSGNFVGVF